MAGWQWKQDYEALVRESAERGELQGQHRDPERRERPRFRLKSQHVTIKVESSFDVVDVSVTGIALLSDFPFQVGQVVNITLGKAFAVEATVVDCPLVPSDEDLLEAKYQVRCRFEDEAAGMQFLVIMKQMDDLELAPRQKPRKE
jgi:PilZ domain